MSKILFVSKDIGGSAMTIPLAKEAQTNGCEVCVVTEHLAAKKFEDAGFKAYFSTTADFSQKPFYVDVHKCLQDVYPDVVVVSAGAPIHLEQLFAVFSSQMSIPLVCIEDYWTVSRKIKPAHPDLIVSIDSYGKNLVRQLFPDTNVVVVGHHEVTAVVEAKKDTEGLHVLSDKTQGFDFVCTLIGGGEQTTSQLKLILECMKQSSGRWCLVPRFHPKTLQWKDKEGRVLGDVWNEMLKPFDDCVVYLPEVKTETVVAGVHVVASGFSTLMSGAAYIGKPTLCLRTEETMEDLHFQSGGVLTEVPIVALQCADVVDEPTDLSQFLERTHPRAQEEFRPYNPAMAYEAIKCFL